VRSRRCGGGDAACKTKCFESANKYKCDNAKVLAATSKLDPSSKSDSKGDSRSDKAAEDDADAAGEDDDESAGDSGSSGGTGESHVKLPPALEDDLL
jgi:hypothetical protein